MNWSANQEACDSDNEMFQMSSSRMRDDGSHVRLLSVSEDEEQASVSPQDAGLPHLNFRQSQHSSTKFKEEKKSRAAALSILVVGVILIIIINIGLGIKLKNMHGYPDKSVSSTVQPSLTLKCPVKKEINSLKCNSSFPWQMYRLPSYIHPEFYSIFLHPNLTLGNYSGEVDIIVSVSQATDLIVIHSKELNISALKVYSGWHKRGDKIPAEHEVPQQREYQVCTELDFVAIQLSDRLQTQKQYTIHVEFIGSLTMSLNGFYLSKYKTKTGVNKTLATTQFEALSARKAFPCFDEPAMKANFSVNIVIDNTNSALSNMPVENTSDFGDDLKLVKFQTSVAMSTYLLAFIIVPDFDNITNEVQLQRGSTPVSVYAPKDKIKSAQFALEVASKVLIQYEKTFKISYPLPKLDLIAIPDFAAGAMENWGLVTYRETAILWDEKTSSISDKEWVAIVVAHELAHQWFGNLVTMEWWNDLWLNEGFASYVEFFGVNHIYPEWNLMETFHSLTTADAMTVDENENTHPISVPVNSAIQIEELFDDITYKKGACLISMMISYLGEDNFYAGITDYLSKFAYSNANNKDLTKAVVQHTSTANQRKNVLRMLESWTVEPGFPVLNVSLDGKTVIISQMRYMLELPASYTNKCNNKSESLWQIPLSYMTDKSKDSAWEFIENRTYTFTLQDYPKWMILNANRRGYYLINYSIKMLESLILQLKTDHTAISALDRSGILFNVAKSAKAGLISYDRLLDLMTYLEKEEEYGPFYSALLILSDFKKILKMQFHTNHHKKMKHFSKNLLSHIYSKYGWPTVASMQSTLTHPEIKLRRSAIKLMCAYDNENCTNQALIHFRKWMDNNTQLEVDYKDIVYSTGIRLGLPEDWKYMWNKYTKDLTLDASEKNKLLKALCHRTDEKTVEFLLDEAIKGENIRHQDADTVVHYLTYSGRVGSMMAWKFVRSKWEEITSIFLISSFTVQRMAENIFQTFTDESEIAGAEKFMEMHNLTGIRYFKRALEKAKFNVHWIETYQPQVFEWLDKNIADSEI
uniref:endoplasmic reticulum aminopeptidase 1-like n=1 Tax=Styela clava TaxID=7725 RepID=UPI00193A5C83|nr:endoplasmic reticulum aminopeptidase 1-like [Styela clava]